MMWLVYILRLTFMLSTPLVRLNINFLNKHYLGHPELLDLNLDINWTKPEDLRPYRGIFKLFIIPPDDLYLPVIPERIHGKLVC